MSEGYKNPICTKCGKEIKFIPLKFFDGQVHNIPVEVKDEYLMTMTNEKNEKGQYLWTSTRIAVNHSKACLEGGMVYDSQETKKPVKNDSEAVFDGDKPPF